MAQDAVDPRFLGLRAKRHERQPRLCERLEFYKSKFLATCRSTNNSFEE